MNSTYEFTLKERAKVKMENCLGTKSWRKLLEGLKRKVGIFTGTKIYLTLKNIMNQVIDHSCVLLRLNNTPIN